MTPDENPTTDFAIPDENPTTDLAIPGIADLVKHDDSEFKAMVAASQSYLPRMQLAGGNSTIVKEGKIAIAHWALINGDVITDLGTETDVLVLAWQPKAMDTSVDPPISVIDQKSAEFQRIRDKSEIQDSGCMWGPEFLVYLIEQEVFASLFFASKTARREGNNVHALIGNAATLKSKFIKKQKYSWHGPVVVPCSAAFDPPTPEEIQEAAKKFVAVTQSKTEVVDEKAAGDERAR